MLSLTPFLLFDGNCAEAMAFYQQCLGGELTVTTVSETPMKEQMPAAQHHKVAYAQLAGGDVSFSTTDWLHPTRARRPGNTVAMYINGESHELRQIFDQLAVGANQDLLDELQPVPFGTYGHLADKYGINWFFRGETAA
jgi:PhnB protein